MIEGALTVETATASRPRRRVRRTRLAFSAMLVIVVAWAFAWGAHEHGPPGVAADLSGYEAARMITVDASTGTFDLSAINVTPGEVVDLLLAGSAGGPHAFAFTGATLGAEMDTRLAASGDTIVRLRVPEEGSVSFLCVIPGHEGLHGTLVVNPPQ